jgi:predicted RNA-binding Zn-ribbon protein involved in translation (DUF1610 family)
MPTKQKVDLAKVMASLGTVCTNCGCSIPPERVRRVDFEHVACPQCGEPFVPDSKIRDKVRH